jgi:hypothetical protein
VAHGNVQTSLSTNWTPSTNFAQRFESLPSSAQAYAGLLAEKKNDGEDDNRNTHRIDPSMGKS